MRCDDAPTGGAVVRLLAAQATVLAAATRAFARHPTLGPRPGVFGYARSSPYRWVPWIVLLTVPADALILAVVLPAGWEAVGWLLMAATLYLLVWTVGVGVTLRERPHVVGPERVVLRHGVLGCTTFAPDAVMAATVHPGFPPGTPGARAYLRGAGVLMVGLGPFVDVRLRAPVTLCGLVRDREVTRLALAADDPSALCRALAPLAAPHGATSPQAPSAPRR